MSAGAVSSAVTIQLSRLHTVYSLFTRGPNVIVRPSNYSTLAQFVGSYFKFGEMISPVVAGVRDGGDMGTGESYVTRVDERKCSSQYKLFDNSQVSTEKDLDFSPKPNLYLLCYTRHHAPYFNALSVEEDGNVSPKCDVMYPPRSPNKCFSFTSSCNGLFCFDDWDGNIFFWNPTTNESKILPRSTGEHPPGVTEDVEDSRIWFDLKSRDYKVVRLMSFDFENEDGDLVNSDYQIELYSLKTHSWKKISCTDFSICGFPWVCISGIYYCKAQTRGENISVILSFDISTETLSALPFPNLTRSHCIRFLDYNGVLSIISYTVRGIEKSLELWVMTMDGSWARESIFQTCGVERPVGFWRNGELLFLESSSDELLVYDRATGKLKHLGVYRAANPMQLVPFVESSVRLTGI